MPVGSDRHSRNGVGFFDVANYGAIIEGSSGGVGSVRLNAFARQNTPDRPFAVVNDYVASTLGMAVGLPVPPGTLFGLHGGDHGYVSLAFGHRGDVAPPIIPPKFCADRPWEACGIIAFDHWVLNTDRHDQNLSHIPDIGVAVFDHDLSLINVPPSGEDAVTALAKNRDIVYKYHCLTRHITDPSHFPEWFARIGSVTRREIRRAADTCHSAKLIDASTRDALVSFLEYRQTRIRTYVNQTRDLYQNVASWTLDMEEEDGGS